MQRDLQCILDIYIFHYPDFFLTALGASDAKVKAVTV